MDVQHWLDSIVWEDKGNQHALPDDVEFAAFFYPPDNLCGGGSSAQAARVASKTLIKKKEARAFSDSSFLQRDVNCRKVHANTRHNSHGESLPANSLSASSASSTSSSSSTKSSQQFKRRRRRKTRPDRYEPVKEKPIKKKKKTHGEVDKKKKKAKIRKKAGKAVKTPNDDVVQRFHATNVLTDRLTSHSKLKPQGNLGIFNRGRVSSTAKGKGVPDLAMPSLSFLQRPYSASRHAEAAVEKRARKKKTQVEEEEISAFFAHARPPLTKQDNNNQPESSCKSKKAKCSKNSGRVHSIGIDRPVSASSSKVPLLGGKTARDSSSACFSWSNSGSNEDTSQPPRKKQKSSNPQRVFKQSSKSHVQRHAKGIDELQKSSAKGRSNCQRVLVPVTPLSTLEKPDASSHVEEPSLYHDMPAHGRREGKKMASNIAQDSTAAPERELGQHMKSPLANQNPFGPYAEENQTLQSSPPSLTRPYSETLNAVPSRPLRMSSMEDECCLSAHDIGQPLESESGIYTPAPAAFAYPRVARAINPLCVQPSHFVMQSNREEKTRMNGCDVVERREGEYSSSEVYALGSDYGGCVAEVLEFRDMDSFDVSECEDVDGRLVEMEENQGEWDDGLQGFWRPHRLH